MNDQSKDYLLNEYNFCMEMVKHQDQLWLQMLKFYITINSALFLGAGAFIKYSFDKSSFSLPIDFTIWLLSGIIRLKSWLIWPLIFMIGFNIFYLIYLRSKKKKNVEYIRAINKIRKGFMSEMGDNAKACIGLPSDIDIPKYFNIFGTDSINAILIIIFNTLLASFLIVLTTLPSDINLIQIINRKMYLGNLFMVCVVFLAFQLWIFLGYLYKLDKETTR